MLSKKRTTNGREVVTNDEKGKAWYVKSLVDIWSMTRVLYEKRLWLLLAGSVELG